MAGWSLARIPEILAGPDLLDRLGELLRARLPAPVPVLLVADPGLGRTGLIDRARRSLDDAGLPVLLFDGFRSDPSMAATDAAAALAARGNAGAMVALGGGSAMDLGKVAAAIARAGRPAATFGLAAAPLPTDGLLKVAIPTTAGTGSETTRTSVLTDAEGRKVWLWGDALKFDLVLLDPTASTGLPPALTAATGVDALVHAIEATTNRNAFPANDLFCLEAIRLVMRWLPRAVAAGDDLEARAAMLHAAALAGIGIDNAGTALAHNIAHALGSLLPIHHGRATGLAMRATLAWNTADDPDGRYAAVAAAMGAEGGAAGLSAAFDQLLHRIGLRPDPADGFDRLAAEALAAQMARAENAAMRRSNRRDVEDSDLLPLARAVLSQSAEPIAWR